MTIGSGEFFFKASQPFSFKLSRLHEVHLGFHRIQQTLLLQPFIDMIYFLFLFLTCEGLKIRKMSYAKNTVWPVAALPFSRNLHCQQVFVRSSACDRKAPNFLKGLTLHLRQCMATIHRNPNGPVRPFHDG